MPNRSPSVAVVGGSIAGPAAALLLLHAGVDQVTVYEATPPTVSPAGGVIGLDHASLDVFDHLGIDQAEYVPFSSERIVAIKVLDRHAEGQVRTIYPGRNTTWTLLHQSLERRLPAGTYQAGRRVTGVGEAPGGQALLAFADGGQAAADLVVFADGRRSAGRRLLDPQRRLRYAGYVAHRGLHDGCPPDLVDFTRYEAGSAQFNLFPVAQPDGTLGLDWTFYLNETDVDFRHHFGATPTRRTFVMPDQMPDAVRRRVDAHAYALLPETEAAMVRATGTRMAAPVVDIDPPTRMVWPVAGRGRAVLIGDALAPVRPHTARGANAGIDQAAGLAAALRQHHRHGADLDGALHGWESRHLPQVAHAVAAGPTLGARLGLGLA